MTGPSTPAQQFSTTVLEFQQHGHFELGYQYCQHPLARLKTTDICAKAYRVAAMSEMVACGNNRLLVTINV